MAVCHDNDTPSVKSLGKRPAQATTTPSLPPKGRGKGKGTGSSNANHNSLVADDSAPMGASPNPAQIRQKRILPSRLRRGGPGIGNCDTDVAILDVLKRQGMSQGVSVTLSANVCLFSKFFVYWVFFNFYMYRRDHTTHPFNIHIPTFNRRGVGTVIIIFRV